MTSTPTRFTGQPTRMILLLLAGWLIVAHAYADQGPLNQVRSTVEAVLDNLKNKDLPKATLTDRIRSLIKERFDYHAMAQRALAVHWKKATPKIRDRFTELFSKTLESTYLGRIEAYTDERVEYVKERIKGNKSIVDTKIVTANTDIPVTYRLHRSGDKWLVYDVKIEDVSLIRNYRSTYGEIVNNEGFDGLLAKMEAKLESQANESGSN